MLTTIYAGMVGTPTTLRDGEDEIVSITPVARGVVRPMLITVVIAVTLFEGSHHSSLIHNYAGWLGIIFVAPSVLLILARVWRWRSHKIHVTSHRVVVEGGVLSRSQFSIELKDVIVTRVERRFSEQVTRRGVVVLETVAGPVEVGRVHHPAALGRIIDNERHKLRGSVPTPDQLFDGRSGFFHPTSNLDDDRFGSQPE